MLNTDQTGPRPGRSRCAVPVATAEQEQEKEPELPSDSINSDTAGAAAAAAATAVIAAAAARVKGPQSLSLYTVSPIKCGLPCDTLLPLTAAAGGPGSSLEKLSITGNFITGTEAAAVTCASGAVASRVSSSADVANAHLAPAVGHLTDELSAVDIACNSSAATAPAFCDRSSQQVGSPSQLVAEGSNLTAANCGSAAAFVFRQQLSHISNANNPVPHCM